MPVFEKSVFFAPNRVTVTLLLEQADKDDDMWIYLPAIKKTHRLVSDNKRDSAVGWVSLLSDSDIT